MTLSPFPVDDVTLDLVEHSLGAAYDADEDGDNVLVGADMNLHQLLGFLDGTAEVEHERKQAADVRGEHVVDMTDMTSYHVNDVIRALIAEVRRLRDDARGDR